MVNSNIKFRNILVRFGFGLGVIGFVLLGVNLYSQHSEASTPATGTLTTTSAPVTYTSGPFNVANATPVIMVDAGPRCNTAATPCDSFILTVTLPVGYVAANPNASIKFTTSWGDTGTGNSDYDLYVYKGTVAASAINGAKAPDAKSASGSNPEIANFSPLSDGTQRFTVIIVPYTPTAETLTTKIELLAGAAPAPGGGVAGCTINCNNFGATDPTVPGNPRYQNFYAPTGTTAQAGSGEFNIGYNATTKRIMTMNYGPIWRLTPPEVQGKPECCEALWENKNSTVTDTGLDPILWTDGGYFGKNAMGVNAYIVKSGRTFASNATAGANAAYAYSDNDGDSYIPFGAGIPAGADHQTIGSGPFPASLSSLGNTINKGNFVLYCTQDLVGSNCESSLDLGASYANLRPATGPGTLNSQGCGGLHGHTHIAPDGTAWMPDKSCGGKQGGSISIDASTTAWSEFSVSKAVADANGPAFTTTPQANGADPSIALDANSTAYFCYVNSEAGGSEGRAHVAVGKRRAGTTIIDWIRDTDVGATHGIVNAAHTEAVGGSAGRAACGFMGTNVGGDYQPNNFAGKWYVFIATTYDEGVNWTTVNATPNDPVQSMSGIWQQGGSATDRNLLDFNEVTVDEKGRVLYGYSDGCYSLPCIGGTGANDFGAYMRVARQSGGKTLFADLDPVEPAAAKPACLSGTRDTASGSHLSWKIPDNGGSDIVGYVILRSTTPGGESVLVGNTGSARNSYDDPTAADNTPHYYYTVQAINQNGAVVGTQSNEIDLVATVPLPIESACLLNGLTTLTDKSADSLDMLPGHDVLSLQIGEPYKINSATVTDKIIFTLKMASLATVPPNTRYPIVFTAPNGTSYTARMTNVPTDGATGGTPIFQIGPTAGTFVAADAASNYSADGTIKIVFPLSAIGSPAVGENLTNFLVRITESGVAVTVTPDNMPDSLAPTGSYRLIGNASCAPITLFESDVLGTAIHTTDGLVDSTDVAQTRRYQIGFDLPYAAGEFQRADAAPLATFGDGTVDALDVAQARRYQAGLDPLQPVAGPTAPSSLAASALGESSSSSAEDGSSRTSITRKTGVLRVVSQKATAGETVTVLIETDARGDESIYGFTLNYDAGLLTYVPNSAAVGKDAGRATVLTNATVPGQLGFSMDFAGQTMAAGLGRQLLSMQFTTAGGKGGTAAMRFGDELARRSVASNPVAGTVRALAVGFVGGTVEISGSKPRLAGRVATASNRSVAGAEVRLTDSRGHQLVTRTNAFGYYRFERLAEGTTYALRATHPGHRFAPQTVTAGGADETANLTATR